MKKIFICFLLVFLCGCQVTDDLTGDLDKMIGSLNDTAHAPNHSKTYYRFYKPRDVDNLVSHDTYNIFEYQGIEILFTLNVSNIINDAYYTLKTADDKTYSDDNLIYQKTVVINDIENKVKIYEYDDNYILIVSNFAVSLAANVYNNYVVSTLKKMLILSSNVDVETELVIKSFSNKETIDYEKEQVDLFKVIIPSSGSLEELIGQDILPNDETAEENAE